MLFQTWFKDPEMGMFMGGDTDFMGIFQQPVFDCGRVHISEPAVVCS